MTLPKPPRLRPQDFPISEGEISPLSLPEGLYIKPMKRVAPIADFLNNCIDYEIKAEMLPNTKGARKPWYIRTDIFTKGAREWIVHLLQNSRDVVVVAKSLRYPPMYLLENELVNDGIPCYKSDHKPINQNCAEGRVLLTTLDALSPSDTRRIAVVMTAGMTTPQEIFRSCSRAMEWLIVIDDCRLQKGSLPFKIDDDYINDVNKRANGSFGYVPEPKTRAEVIKIPVIREPITSEWITLPIFSRNTFVADITGLAIPMLYEYRNTGKITIIDIILNHKKCVLAHKRFIHFADFNKIGDVLKLANLYLYFCQGYKSKYVEIKMENYDWLKVEVIEELLNRLRRHISTTETTYEVEIGDYRVDAVDNSTETVWEIKCKRSITEQDIAQLSRYAQADGFKRKYRLINLLSEEILTLNIENGTVLENNHSDTGGDNCGSTL